MKKILVSALFLMTCFCTRNLSAWSFVSPNGANLYYSVRSDDGSLDRIYVTNNSSYSETISVSLTYVDNVSEQLGFVLCSPGSTQCFGWVGRNDSCCSWNYRCVFTCNP